MFLTALDLLNALHKALDEEARGIKELDLEAVKRANEAKANILWLLRETPPNDRAPLYESLDATRDRLYSNLILVTHAHQHLRDVRASANDGAESGSCGQRDHDSGSNHHADLLEPAPKRASGF